jgi:hypothetical protein
MRLKTYFFDEKFIFKFTHKLLLIFIFFAVFCSVKSIEKDEHYFKHIKTTQIETNFTYLDANYFQYINKKQILVDESNLGKIIFSERFSDRFYELFEKNNNIIISKNFFKLPDKLESKKLSQSKIISIKFSQFDANILYTSVISSFDSVNDCVFFLLYEFNIQQNKFNLIFKSEPCVTNANDMDDLEGKVSDSENFIFISSGNVLLNNYNVTFQPDHINHHDCMYKEDYMKCLNISNLYGKVIRIRKKDKKVMTLAIGNRRPQGILWDFERNLLFLTDHGPRGGDKLNIIRKGKNYGWPFRSIGIPYTKDQEKINNENFKGEYNSLSKINNELYEDPIYSFVPSIGISDIDSFAMSVDFEIWRNNLLIGSLKDKSLYNINISNNTVKYAEKIHIGERIRNVSVGMKRVIISTDSGNIVILRRNFNKKMNGAFPNYSL